MKLLDAAVFCFLAPRRRSKRACGPLAGSALSRSSALQGERGLYGRIVN